MLQPVRCVKFGEVLLDENRRSFLMCVKCHTNFPAMQEFHNHLENCFQQLFWKNTKLAFGIGSGKQLKGNTRNGSVEFRVYQYNEVSGLELSTANPEQAISGTKMERDDDYMDLIKIEEELLDPRWYTDLTDIDSTPEATPEKVLAYNELVEAVTPYVQFKENVKACENAKRPKQLIKTYERKFPKQQQIDIVKESERKDPKTRQFQHKVDVGYNERSYSIANKRKKLELEGTQKQDVKPSIVEQHQSVTVHKLMQNGGKRRKGIIIPAENIRLEAQSQLECVTQKPEIPPLKMYQRKVQQASGASTPSVTIRPVANGSLNVPKIKSPNADTTTAQQQKRSLQVLTTPVKCCPPTTAYQATPSTYLREQPIAVLVAPAPKEQQTTLILNKLQTLGLQVKRTNPPAIVTLATNSSTVKPNEMDELLKKLQSKGMHIKVLPKKVHTPEVTKSNKLNLGTRIEGTSAITGDTSAEASAHSTNILTTNPGWNKNISIKLVK